jgi:uncharacterized membrane protein YsdA (DUF1294 family)
MVIVIYAGASLIAFVAYALDKAAARAGRWRTQESTLHLLALIGGWPGALLAQRQFRHKTARRPSASSSGPPSCSTAAPSAG